MQREEENEVRAMDSLLSPSFSVYSSNNINDVALQVINENDFSHFQNDIDNFEFVAFQKTEAFFHHSSISKHDDAAESLIQKRNIDPPSSSEVEDDLDDVPPTSCCLWSPKSPKVSPIGSPINCKKSNSTGSNSSSPKRWKFLSLLRRSKSDGKESLILVTPSLEVKKEARVENSKIKSGEKIITRVSEKRIPVTERKVPATVTAMETFYLRSKETKRKSYLPYKQELIGFGVGSHTNIGRGFPLHV